MNFSTNQVLQLYVLDNASSTVSENVEASQTATKGVQIRVLHKDGTVEACDVINALVGRVPADTDIVNGTTSGCPVDTVKTKAGIITAAAGTIAAGEEYIISLTFRGFGQEDVIIKTISAKAPSTTAADLYEALAKSAWVQRGIEVEPLYDLYDGAKHKIVAYDKAAGKLKYDNSGTLTNAVFTNGFIIAEAVPFWKLGSFPETLATVEIGSAPVVVSGVERNDWLVVSSAGTGDGWGEVSSVSVSLDNTRKLADLELFCKGERGNSDALANWPDNISPDLYIVPTNPRGASYSSTPLFVLSVHAAFVGANDEVQKSEKDLVFVSSKEADLKAIVDALDGTTYTVPVIA